MLQAQWKKNASNLIKAELAKRDISYEQLHKKLESIGVKETPGGINAKINRGSFSFAFFLQVMQVMRAKILRVEEE